MRRAASATARRAGLTFAPTAVVFGVGLVLKGGDEGGALLYLAFCGVGGGLALAFSPTFTHGLATVGPKNAAHCS